MITNREAIMWRKRIVWFGLCGVLIAPPSLYFWSARNVVRLSPALTRSDEPGGSEADAGLARSNPDEYAWDLFFYLARQAKSGAAGVPDPSVPTFRDNEEDKPAVWESWALASGGSDRSEVFKCPAGNPGNWYDLANKRNGATTLVLTPNLTDSFTHKRQELSNPIGEEAAQEVRFNHVSFDTILSKDLWSTDGVLAAVRDAKSHGDTSFVTYPAGAKEIKAVWVKLKECKQNASCPEKKRYYWRSSALVTGAEVWGLAAIHIMTKEKDMPNWFWADFIHEDCLTRELTPCSDKKTDDTFLGTFADSTTTHTQGIRPETVGTPWTHYRLKGTETGFTKDGQDQLLSDPAIEFVDHDPTSCITCHYYAAASWKQAVTATPSETGIAHPNVDGKEPRGNPNSSILNGGSSDEQQQFPEFLQADFSWSIIARAHAKRDSCE
jgi:hypothetical protein